MTDAELVTLQSEVAALRIENADLREVIMRFWKPKVDALQAWKDAVPISAIATEYAENFYANAEIETWFKFMDSLET